MVFASLDLSTLKYISDDDYRAERFLKTIASDITNASATTFSSKKPVFITINHIVPTVLPYLSALSSVGDVAMIIPKGNNPDPQVHQTLEKAYRDAYQMSLETATQGYRLGITRENLNTPERVMALLQTIQSKYPDRPILIIDIGGYFTQALYIPKSELERRGIHLVGIVEDTENGYQKYLAVVSAQSLSPPNDFPIYSVARSELKKTEDYCVGKSIVEAADTLFRIKKHTIPERMQTVGVMGYGKIGSSIAEHLRRKNIHVFVSESLPLRAQLALANDHNVVFDSTSPGQGYKKLFSLTNTIFGATGQRALTIADLKEWLRFQDVIYLASCTSALDEYDFDPSNLSADRFFRHHREDEQVLEFTAESGRKRVVFFRAGNAVNFCFGGVNGPYIYSVQAALLKAASKLFAHVTRPTLSSAPVLSTVLPTSRVRVSEYEVTGKPGSAYWGSGASRVMVAPAYAISSPAAREPFASPLRREIYVLDKESEDEISSLFLQTFIK